MPFGTSSTPPRGGNPRALSLLGVAIALTVPALALRIFGFDPHRAPLNGMLVYGMCVVAAAFILTWAAEVAELEIGSGLAVVFLALVTVLPEYAVDIYLAWQAGHDPTNYEHLALANMTGANQILIGTGWPVVALLVWYRTGARGIALKRERAGDVVWLLLATLYSCILPLKRSVCIYDALVLFVCYALYVRSSKGDGEGEHDPGALVGPPRVMAAWPRPKRRWWIAVLFAWAAGAILASSEPFSESLIEAGHSLKIDKVLLIKWLAPLASEAPEFVVVVLLTMRGRAEMGLGAFISSKVNQWTLLVGGVPLAYSLSKAVHGHGFVGCLPMDAHMTSELWLTAAQGLYAVATIADLDFSLRQALTILGLFLAQFLTTVLIGTGLLVIPALGASPEGAVTAFHNGFAVVYGLLAVERFLSQRSHLRARFADVFQRRPAAPPPESGERHTPDEQDA
jgi:cation:H+ antiporter